MTTYRSLVTSVYIVMRTDVLEDLGLLEDAQNIQSLADYDKILEAVSTSEKWSTLSGIVPSDAAGTCLGLGGFYLATDSFADATCYDQLGDLNKRGVVLKDGSTLWDLYQERCPLYEKYADIIVNVDGLSIEGAIEKLRQGIVGMCKERKNENSCQEGSGRIL